jgi:hypothetical protein
MKGEVFKKMLPESIFKKLYLRVNIDFYSLNHFKFKKNLLY